MNAWSIAETSTRKSPNYEKIKTMKNRKTRIVLAAIAIALFASAFGGCDIYEKEDIEIYRCPQIRDTVEIPDWEPIEQK